MGNTRESPHQQTGTGDPLKHRATGRTDPRGDREMAPAGPAELLARLEELGIAHTTIQHPAVFTVDEAKRWRGEIPGAHTKNLFVRNKKGMMWLITCLEDRPVDLKAVGEMTGAGRLSFGSGERLMKYLGLTAGSVTPFGLINDRTHAVRFALDREVLDREPLNFHPLTNTMTTSLTAAGFLAFLADVEHSPMLIDFSS